jgi:hypothetical protein
VTVEKGELNVPKPLAGREDAQGASEGDLMKELGGAFGTGPVTNEQTEPKVLKPLAEGEDGQGALEGELLGALVR